MSKGLGGITDFVDDLDEEGVDLDEDEDRLDGVDGEEIGLDKVEEIVLDEIEGVDGEEIGLDEEETEEDVRLNVVDEIKDGDKRDLDRGDTSTFSLMKSSWLR